MSKLENYVGRMVRLKQAAYERLGTRRKYAAGQQENRFLVAAIDRQMRRLICYGAKCRIEIGAGEVVLV